MTGAGPDRSGGIARGCSRQKRRRVGGTDLRTPQRPRPRAPSQARPLFFRRNAPFLAADGQTGYTDGERRGQNGLLLCDRPAGGSPAGLQETLTRYGCNIRLRVGLHEAGEGRCSDDGVILLQVCGEQDEVDRLMAALESTPGVTAKLMDLN